MKNKLLSKNAQSSGLIYSIMIVTYILISFIVPTILSFIINPNSTAYEIICQCISSGVIFAVVIFAKFNGANYSINFNKKGLIVGAPLALMLFVGVFMGFGFVNGKIADWLWSIGLNVSKPDYDFRTPWHFISYFISLVALPAFSEELLFRGVMIKGLNKVKPLFAIIMISLCFALYHCSLAKFVYQFVYSAMICLLYYATESVLSCVIAHFANNLFTLISMYLEWHGYNVTIDLTNIWVIIIGLVVLAGFIAIVVTMIIKKSKNAEPDTKEQKVVAKEEARKFFVFAMFGMVLCTLTIVLSLIPM